MSNTALLILIAIVVIAGIFWLVIYSSRRGEKHRQKTTIKRLILIERNRRVDISESSHLRAI